MAIQDEIRRAINDTLGPIITALTRPQGTPEGVPMQPHSDMPSVVAVGSLSRADLARTLTMNKYYLDDNHLSQVYQWVNDNNIQSESAILGYVDGAYFPVIRRAR